MALFVVLLVFASWYVANKCLGTFAGTMRNRRFVVIAMYINNNYDDCTYIVKLLVHVWCSMPQCHNTSCSSVCLVHVHCVFSITVDQENFAEL